MDHEKNQVYPLAPAQPRSDEEYANPDSEARRKKRIKLFMYIAAFAVFQTIVILIFALTVMRVKTPNLRIRSVTVQNPNVGTSSFNMTLIAEVTVRNKNFGKYKYDSATMNITYDGAIVGTGFIPNGNAKAKKTRRVNVTMQISSNAGVSDVSSGILRFNSQATLSGKVHLMKVIKKRKTARMNCTMAFNLTSQTFQDLSC